MRFCLHICLRASLLLLLGGFFAFSASAADYPVKDTDKYAYAENAGWVNFKPTGQGATLHANGASSFLTGYVWAENVGYIKLAYDNNAVAPFTNTTNSNWGVNADAAGNLSGYAWSKTSGWIKFDHSYTPVTFNTSTGVFDGYAWSQNLGWIHFKNAAPAYNVSFALTATLTTTAISSITSTSAASGGTITDQGANAVTARGVCWNSASGPTIANSFSVNGAGTGAFSSALSGLTPNTVYYVRAYATNANGTSYGNEISFTTSLALSAPTVTTTAVSSVGQSTASSGGTVTSDGNATVTARGVCWNTSPGATTANTNTVDGTGTGAFTSSISGLSSSTTYYLRAYATNSQGTAYGADVSFTTVAGPPPPPPPGYPPRVKTSEPFQITPNSAKAGGSIPEDGGVTVTERGVCWNTTGSPNLMNDASSLGGGGLGAFTASVTNLEQNTSYYLRAYATNSAGTSYGAQMTFKTLDANVVVYWRNRDSGQNYIQYLRNTEHISWAPFQDVANGNWRIAGVGDLNGCSKPELLWRNSSNGLDKVWTVSGNIWTGTFDPPTVPPEWLAHGLGAFHHNAQLEILWRHRDRGDIWVQRMQGLETQGYERVGSVPDMNWQIAAVADMDLDGNADIIWRHRDGRNAIWYMNGVNMRSWAWLPEAGGEWRIGGVADFNADGKPDILWRNYNNGDVFVELMYNGVHVGYQGIAITNHDTAWEIVGAANISPTQTTTHTTPAQTTTQATTPATTAPPTGASRK